MLTAAEAKEVLVNISNGSYNQVKSLFLTVFMMRSISIELSGFRDALLVVYVLI
jgi:anthranilate phosphoribosyltransferase